MILPLSDTHFLHIYFRNSSIFFLPKSTPKNTPFLPYFPLFFPPFPWKWKFCNFFFFQPFFCLSKRHFPAFLQSSMSLPPPSIYMSLPAPSIYLPRPRGQKLVRRDYPARKLSIFASDVPKPLPDPVILRNFWNWTMFWCISEGLFKIMGVVTKRKAVASWLPPLCFVTTHPFSGEKVIPTS